MSTLATTILPFQLIQQIMIKFPPFVGELVLEHLAGSVEAWKKKFQTVLDQLTQLLQHKLRRQILMQEVEDLMSGHRQHMRHTWLDNMVLYHEYDPYNYDPDAPDSASSWPQELDNSYVNFRIEWKESFLQLIGTHALAHSPITIGPPALGPEYGYFTTDICLSHPYDLPTVHEFRQNYAHTYARVYESGHAYV